MGSTFIKLPCTGATGALDYQGTWDANANSPALASGVGTKGHYYVVSVAGTTNLDGNNSWQVGDWAVFNGVSWNEVDNATAVSSVFGRTGAVTSATNDYTWAQIDKTTSSLADITTASAADLTSGILNDARVQESNVTQHEGAIDHGSIAGLSDDDHTQYALLAGRVGGQKLIGGSNASDNLEIESTSNATKGVVSILDELYVKDSVDENSSSISLADPAVSGHLALYPYAVGRMGFAVKSYVSQMRFENGELYITNGVIRTGNQSEAGPAYSFIADTDTGMYLKGANNLGFAANAIERLALGTSATVFNETGADVDFRVEGDTEANLLFCDASTDRIGIGTATPSQKLSIEQTTAGIIRGVIHNPSAASASVVGAVWQVQNDNNYWGLIGMTGSGSTLNGGAYADTFHVYNQGYANSLYTVDGNKDHVFSTDPTDSHNFSFVEKMRLTAAGNLGIGVSDPDTKLEIFNAGDQLKLSFDGTDNAVFAVDTAGNLTVTPSGEKVDIQGRLTEQGTYAEIHTHDASTAQSIPTGSTYTKLTGYTDNGLSSNCTADVANDKITITKAGIYRVDGSFNFVSGTANVTWRIAPFLNGVEQDNIHCKRKSATSTDSGSASFTGFIDVTSVPWDLDVRIRHDNGGSVNFTPEYMNINVSYLGET